MRSEVNGSTGVFPFPYTEIPFPQSIDQRIQTAESDLDPILNPGALYWVEGQYVAPDDASQENGLNNASYREVTVSPAFDLIFADPNPGSTVREQSAIYAWQAEDPEVEIFNANVFGSAPAVHNPPERPTFHTDRISRPAGRQAENRRFEGRSGDRGSPGSGVARLEAVGEDLGRIGSQSFNQ